MQKCWFLRKEETPIKIYTRRISVAGSMGENRQNLNPRMASYQQLPLVYGGLKGVLLAHASAENGEVDDRKSNLTPVAMPC